MWPLEWSLSSAPVSLPSRSMSWTVVRTIPSAWQPLQLTLAHNPLLEPSGHTLIFQVRIMQVIESLDGQIYLPKQNLIY